MWIDTHDTEKNDTYFKSTQVDKIKHALGKDIFYHRAYFSKDYSWEQIEKEVNHLIKAYSKKIKVTPHLTLVSCKRKALSLHVSLETRLRAICHAIQSLSRDAVYQSEHSSFFKYIPCSKHIVYTKPLQYLCVLLVSWCVYIVSSHHSIRHGIFLFVILMAVLQIFWLL